MITVVDTFQGFPQPFSGDEIAADDAHSTELRVGEIGVSAIHRNLLTSPGQVFDQMASDESTAAENDRACHLASATEGRRSAGSDCAVSSRRSSRRRSNVRMAKW